MDEKLSLEEISRDLRQKNGNARGDIIIGNLSYIQQEKGDEGLKLIKNKIKELGYTDDLDKIKPLEWYPESMSAMIIISAKEIFQWENKDIFIMGNLTTKYSLVMKMLIKYFSNLEMVFAEASKYWEKYLDVGRLEAVEINDKKNFMVLVIKDYNFHPDICFYHAGRMLKIAQLSLGKENVNIEETKCTFKGDPYHEYLITWK